jgi:predicted nuclease of predicted toxin-antitoxin system
MAKDPSHQLLVDNRKNRSLADPWVIAHAMKENACVVTKEEKIIASNSRTVKIPNVCQGMNVRCINDSDFVSEVNIEFSCRIRTST